MTPVRTLENAPTSQIAIAQAGRIWAIESSELDSVATLLRAGPQGKATAEDIPDPLRIVGRVAIIEIRSILTKYPLSFWGFQIGTSYKKIARAVQRAVASDSVETIVLFFDSGGGSVYGVGEAADAIFEARSSGKKVISFVDGAAASAAYHLASQAERVVLSRRDAIVGSIGVLSVVWDWSRYWEGQGVTIHRFRTGPLKGIGADGAVRISDEELRVLQGQVDRFGTFMVSDIARGRGLPQATIREMADGWVQFGDQAVRSKLADEIRPWHSLIDELAAATPEEVQSQKLKAVADAMAKTKRDEVVARERPRGRGLGIGSQLPRRDKSRDFAY